MTLEEKRDILIHLLNLHRETVDLALALLGENEETYSSILYYFTGYRDFDTYMEDEWPEEECEYEEEEEEWED